jgi:hypothetical protein
MWPVSKFHRKISFDHTVREIAAKYPGKGKWYCNQNQPKRRKSQWNTVTKQSKWFPKSMFYLQLKTFHSRTCKGHCRLSERNCSTEKWYHSKVIPVDFFKERWYWSIEASNWVLQTTTHFSSLNLSPSRFHTSIRLKKKIRKNISNWNQILIISKQERCTEISIEGVLHLYFEAMLRCKGKLLRATSWENWHILGKSNSHYFLLSWNSHQIFFSLYKNSN